MLKFNHCLGSKWGDPRMNKNSTNKFVDCWILVGFWIDKKRWLNFAEISLVLIPECNPKKFISVPQVTNVRTTEQICQGSHFMECSIWRKKRRLSALVKLSLQFLIAWNLIGRMRLQHCLNPKSLFLCHKSHQVYFLNLDTHQPIYNWHKFSTDVACSANNVTCSLTSRGLELKSFPER